MNKMSNMRFATIGAHGLGDAILSLKCASIIYSCNVSVKKFVAVRDEIFKPLKHLFPDITQLSEFYGKDNRVLKDDELVESLHKQYGRFDNIYYIIPDLLYNNKMAFDWRRFRTNPQTIQSMKILTHLWNPERFIFISANTTTPEYKLNNIYQIIKNVASQNPDYKVFYNNLKSWDNTNIDNGDFNGLPENVIIGNDLPFIECIEYLIKSSYCLTIDCGIYHIANELGVPYTLLDTRLAPSSLPWRARWRYDLDHSIPAHTDSISISKLIRTNLERPQTTLIPRTVVIDNEGRDWNKLLLIKNS